MDTITVDFKGRRDHLRAMSDEELKTRFWELANNLVEPLAELGRTHTSPSIERSIVMRMGFTSPEAKAIVTKVEEAGLLGKGAGHILLKVSQADGLNTRKAGESIIAGRDLADIRNLFGGAR
ncbi:MAG: ornithine aminomutase [Candidatus Wallbacteria bacterium HGW-Wallbacteria-1]|uniref:Ornithine aminomutase n=1 Tax=Candidatus Wallbacteria bacterium HGW-Wallbacteria-1 TaxID=2013854 RepID=A0A2N1PLN7_9BACT|nr:MAG: ornithine aminomutase [Candidatus Wallbacteria bacterium HGW-Wallbacteria-1]